MRPDRKRLVLRGDEIRLPAYETGDLTLVKREGDIVVLKEAGRAYWVGHFMPRSYRRAHYRVFRLVGRFSDEVGVYAAEEVVEFPVKP